MMKSQSSPYAQLLSALPEQVQHAAEICSVPHWVDDKLARTLVSKFANLNGETEVTVGHLKSLPIVYPYEDRGWRVTNEIRTLLQERVSGNGLHQEISGFLAREFDNQLENLHDNSPAERELQWRTAFHLAPVDPEESIERLDRFVRYIDEAQLSDLKAAVDLCEEQNRWLSSYEAEVAYFQGRHAYAIEDWESAQKWLQIIWESGRDTRRKAIAGHLLGAILRQSSDERLREAEGVLRASIDLSVQLEERYCQSHACNTLAATLRGRGGKERLKEAAKFARRSLSIAEAEDYRRNVAYALVTLANVLRDLDEVKHYDEIRRLSQRAAYLGDRYDMPQTILLAQDLEAQLLRQAGGNQQLSEAEEILRSSIDLSVQVGDDNQESRTCNTLAATLRDRGGTDRLMEAAEFARRSLSIAEAGGYSRTKTYASVTLTNVLQDLEEEAQSLRQKGEDEHLRDAEDLLLTNIDLFEQLGDDNQEARACNTLAATLRERGGKERLEEAAKFARRSLNIAEAESEAYALVTLANILRDLDEVEHRDEIRRLLQRAKRLGERQKMSQTILLALKSEAQLLRNLDDYEVASQCLRQAIQIDPDRADLHRELGFTLIELGESHFQEAENELRRAQNLAPEEKSTIGALRRLKKMRQAVALRDEGEMGAETPRGYYELGKAYEKGDDYEKAIKCFRRAFRLGYTEPIVRSKLGRLLAIDDEQREEGAEWLKGAVEDGLRDTQTLRNLARSMHKLGHLDEAKSYFSEALRKDAEGQDAQLRNWYGLFLSERGEYEKAYSFLNQALELNQFHPYYANDIGRLILEAGWRAKFPEARKLFEKAIDLYDGNFKWPHLYLKKLDKIEREDH